MNMISIKFTANQIKTLLDIITFYECDPELIEFGLSPAEERIKAKLENAIKTA